MKTLSLCQLARLAQSVEHETLNLRVVGSSPTLGAKTLKNSYTKSASLIPNVSQPSDRCTAAHWAVKQGLEPYTLETQSYFT